MSPTRRARKEEQKEERRRFIIDAAWQLFQETPYPEVTMAQVAERTRLAKGTLYLYFTTKEELFLAVVDQELAKWFHDVDIHLTHFCASRGDASAAGPRPSRARRGAPGAPAEDAPASVASILSTTLAARDAMTRLLGILHSVLEQNVSYEAALRFKLSLLGHVERTGVLLERCLPSLAPGHGGPTLIRMYALLIGMRQVCDPSDVIRDIRSRPDMGLFRINFGEEIRASFALLLSGASAPPLAPGRLGAPALGGLSSAERRRPEG
ncbi:MULTISPECIES: TetR/AcrR family transcriptional regulator [Sorangium]|uniref:Transcriptional regulator, TetR family n=1 Tax=Sorangium cellulosum (strain So ce56) TaxID=448385 RepID=A9FIR0_SORC5|nr:TetR family transcriptional regulator [Sorangium cellulosum]CAN91878.1 transcriptional regulator, TetR family [Sorangium cellulosum So ce56]